MRLVYRIIFTLLALTVVSYLGFYSLGESREHYRRRLEEEARLKQKLFDEQPSQIFDRKKTKGSGPVGTERRAPQVLIIGAPKGGTEAISIIMNMHPNLTSYDTETYFWNKKNKKHQPEVYYAKEMPCLYPGQIALDHTALYFTDLKIIDEIYKFNPKMRFVFVARDPVERSRSHFLMFQKNGLHTKKTFESFACGKKADSSIVTKASKYVEYLQHWYRKFPAEQFLILQSEELKKRPYDVMLKVEKFMNLEHKVHEDNYRYNATRGFYCFNYEGQNHCLRPKKGRAHPNVTEECVQKLTKYFEPFNHRFYELVGHNFGW